jgi:hypothetical protein
MQVFRAQDMQTQAAILQEAAMSEPVIITYHDRCPCRKPNSAGK